METRFTRRHLPHVDHPGAVLFITFRLAGSLPAQVLATLQTDARQWEQELLGNPDIRALIERRTFARIEKYLNDQLSPPNAALFLNQPQVAEVFLRHLHLGVSHSRYLLHRFCIMPNHVHLLLELLPKTATRTGHAVSWEAALERRDLYKQNPHWPIWSLKEVMRTLKGASAREINKLLKRHGAFWQDESFDHIVRSAEEYTKTVTYIDQNPVAANLVRHPGDWPYSTCSRLQK